MFWWECFFDLFLFIFSFSFFFARSLYSPVFAKTLLYFYLHLLHNMLFPSQYFSCVLHVSFLVLESGGISVILCLFAYLDEERITWIIGHMYWINAKNT